MVSQSWGGNRKGAGRKPLSCKEKKHGARIYISKKTKNEIQRLGVGPNFSVKAVDLIESEIKSRNNKLKNNK